MSRALNPIAVDAPEILRRDAGRAESRRHLLHFVLAFLLIAAVIFVSSLAARLTRGV